MTSLFAHWGLPKIALRTSSAMFAALVLSAVLANWATPHLTEVAEAPNLEDTVPRQFGDWKELPSPYVQVSLSTGTDPNMDQPYDQTLMRSYINSSGQQIQLAVAWGKRQRQEVKIHRPDLCYVAQGYLIKTLRMKTFQDIPGSATPITGKHMTAAGAQDSEAVSYWVRIGSIYSESAFQTRQHIFLEGLAGRVPDGVLVRASRRIQSENDADGAFPALDQFLKELVAATPASTRALMIRSQL